MKEIVRVNKVPSEFNHAALRQMFPGYTVLGDPNGFFYAVKQTKTVFVSYGWSTLIDAVKAHMAGNNIAEPLTIEMQMADWFCQYKPDFCIELVPERESRISAWKMMKRFFTSAMNTWQMGGYVNQETANERAAICAGCPKNTDQVVEFCVGCHTRGLLSSAEEAMSRRSTPYDGRLKNCAVCHCVNRLKVWMPKAAMEEDGLTEQWPDFCWMKK